MPDLAKDGVVNSLRTQPPILLDQAHCGCSEVLKRNLTPEIHLGRPLIGFTEAPGVGVLDKLGVAVGLGLRTKKPLVGVVVLWLCEIKVSGDKNRLCGA